ncbi:hypothetical protein [Edaphobacter acidisoli]|nr:hypothetical protein [Edaphobacter acidisoli]
MVADPILALEALGYTEREAAFLYLVAAHCGYFLRRQFDYFIDRNKGSIAMRLLARARELGHIESIDYPQGWHVYHVCSRTIYRLLGDPESQLRRIKGDAAVRAQLMALDYILENEGDHFVATGAERLRFFGEIRRVSSGILETTLDPLLLTSPVSLADRTRPTQSAVRFAFIDEGLSGADKFLRYLSVAEPLLRALDNFEVVYVACSDFNFAAVKTAFWDVFANESFPKPGLFNDAMHSDRRKHHVPLQARFTTLLLNYIYPQMQRSEPKGSEKVRT